MPASRAETLDAILRRRASELPNHTVLRYLPDGETEAHRWTYSALDRRARAIAAQLLTLQAPGRPVLLVTAGGPEPLAALFGCWAAGMIAVPLAPPRAGQPPNALGALAADAGATLGLVSADLWPQLNALASDPPVRWLAIEQLGAEPADWRAPSHTPSDPAVLLYTSGSTSQPKGVVLSHFALWGAPFRRPPGLALLGPLHGVNWLPLHHVAGLNNTLLMMRIGPATGINLPAEVVLAQPERWLRAISRYRAMLAGAPNFLYQHCVDRLPAEARAGLNLRRWRFAFCTSEPIHGSTLRQFAAAYAPAGFNARAFVAAYGLSEQPAVATGRARRVWPQPPRQLAVDRAALADQRVQRVAAETADAVRLVSNGRLGEGVSVMIVDPATRTPRPPSTVGEVWTRSPYMASGYWNQPAASAATFGAHLADGRGPYLRTGDLGFLDEGELFICGRLKEMIIVRGQNYYVQDIEAAAAGSHPDLGSAAAAFAVPAATPAGDEQVVVYHEVRPGCAQPDVDAISAAIRRAVSRQLQLTLTAVVLVPADTLPRSAIGKIRRYLVREDYLAHHGGAG